MDWREASVTDGGVDLAAAICPNDQPDECPPDTPSWSADGGVAAIFAARCASCHAAGGAEATVPLDTYATVFARRTTVLSQVLHCLMPPPDAGQLTAPERAEVLDWLVCDAPE